MCVFILVVGCVGLIIEKRRFKSRNKKEERDKMQKKLQTNTAEEILSTVYKPIEYFIDGLLAQGLYILAGSQKVGKSWLALDICHSIATGSDVLKRKTVQGTTLYLCLEDNFVRIQDRLFSISAEPTENMHFAVMADTIGNGLENQIEDFYLYRMNHRQ